MTDQTSKQNNEGKSSHIDDKPVDLENQNDAVNKIAQLDKLDNLNSKTEYTPTNDERSWATIAHLSILLSLVTGMLGIIVAFIIYLVYKDKSKYVAYQAAQSAIFQLVALIGGGLLIATAWVVTIPLLFILVGLLLLPFTIIISMIPTASLIYGVIAAIETSSGKDFKYWQIGDWVRDIYQP